MFILTFMIRQVAVNENALKGDARINFEIIVSGGKSFIEHTHFFYIYGKHKCCVFLSKYSQTDVRQAVIVQQIYHIAAFLCF